MDEEKNKPPVQPALNTTDLAFERTMLAHERTLMAWVRTAVSLISFGFTIYKFFQELKGSEGHHRLLTPRLVGLIMISFGLIALILAQVQHHIAIKKIKQNYPAVQKSLTPVIAILVLIFGLILFLGAFFRQ